MFYQQYNEQTQSTRDAFAQFAFDGTFGTCRNGPFPPSVFYSHATANSVFLEKCHEAFCTLTHEWHVDVMSRCWAFDHTCHADISLMNYAALMHDHFVLYGLDEKMHVTRGERTTWIDIRDFMMLREVDNFNDDVREWDDVMVAQMFLYGHMQYDVCHDITSLMHEVDQTSFDGEACDVDYLFVDFNRYAPVERRDDDTNETYLLRAAAIYRGYIKRYCND